MNFESALPLIRDWQQDDQTIVLSTGVFDILHIEHMRFLVNAKKQGDKLVVGIETDERVKEIKGEHRPVNDQATRLEQLACLKPVDLPFILPKDFDDQADWDAFMAAIKPDVYAVSSHTGYIENKKMLTEKYGGQLRIVRQHNPDISTTKIFQKLTSEL